MSSNTKKSLIAIFVLVVALFIIYYFKKNDAVEKAASNAVPGPIPVEVTVIKIAKQNTQLFVELPARVNAYKTSDVRPRAGGVIRKQIFKEGSFVNKGDQLYEIDPTPYQIELNNAQANLKSISAKYKRYKDLIDEDAISKQEFDDMKAALAKAQADFKTARNNLNYSKVYAPISGYIGKSNFTEGTLVTADQTDVLTTITQLDPVYVDMTQPSSENLKIGEQKEMLVSLITEDGIYPEKGVLKFSEVFADETTDSVRLRSIFPNHDKKLIPGMLVTAKVHLKPIDALTVPQRVTSRGADENLIVWLVNEENIANPQIIKAKNIYGNSWIVEDGLKEGDVVIYEGFMKIAPGAKVKPVYLEEKKNEEKENEEKKNSENKL